MEPTFDDATAFAQGRAAISREGRWGYIDRSGALVIEPRYAEALPFQDNGLAWVRDVTTSTWGAIDREGSIVIRPSLARVTPFEGGVAAVAIDIGARNVAGELRRVYSFGLMDEAGTWILAPRQDIRDPELISDLGPLSEGLAPAHIGERWGYVDAMGATRIPLQFDDAEPFAEGLAAVKKGSRWGYVRRDGTMAVTPSFRGAAPFSEGVAAVRVGRHGFTRPDGSAPFTGSYERAYSFSDGLAPVKIDGAWAFVTRDGDVAIPAGFSRVLPDGFRDGLAVAAVRDPEAGWFASSYRWGVIDREGAWVVEPRFTEVAAPGHAEGAFAVAVRTP